MAYQIKADKLDIAKVAGYGKLWQKSDKKRIYFDSFSFLIDIEYDDDGSFLSATIKGVGCSVSMLEAQIISVSKTYYDYADNSLHSSLPDEYVVLMYDRLCQAA